MCELFLSDGTCLVGKDAEEYLTKKLACLKGLSKKIDQVIDECKILNVIEEDDSLAYSVMETGERLSSIQISLEMLLEEMSSKL